MPKPEARIQKSCSKLVHFRFCALILALRLRSVPMVSVVEPLVLAFCVLNLMGCVTVPPREGLPTYNINGVIYLPLVSLCEKRGINWEYDTFTRTAVLNKGAHRLNLMVGDELVLVDGKPQHLRYPVALYQGAVVVPYKFKEQILDIIFKETPSTGREILRFSRIRKVVIDPGHGGSDPGAIGRTGLKEKDVNLDIAKRLAGLLKTQGIEVAMTRSADFAVPLSRRVEIANNCNADIFLSIHSNANRIKSMRGFEVYYVSANIKSDYQRALSVAQENAKLDLESSYFAASSLDLKATLWDMIYTDNRAESIALARAICRAIYRNLDAHILGIKGANFYVLKGVRIPALLIETGFLSNRNEERMLKNNFYRQQIADLLWQGLENYIRDYALIREASK